MRYCPNCGSVIEEGVKFCTNCGKKLELSEVSQTSSKSEQKAEYELPEQMEKDNDQLPKVAQSPAKPKHSGLGITAFILSLTLILSPVGLILAILDLILNRKKKHGLTIAALIIGGIITFIWIIGITNSSDSSGTGSAPTAVTENSTIESKGEGFSQNKDSEKAANTTDSKAETKADYIATCETVKYKDVARDPDAFNGKKVRVEGQVVQISEGILNSVTLRVATGRNGYDDIWYVRYTRSSDEKRILEDDRVILYGECKGVESYTTVLGSQVTIPSLNAKYIEIVELSQPEYTTTIVKFDITKESYGDGYEYTAFVEVKNTGTSNIYLKGTKFDIEDDKGHLVHTDEYGVSSCPDVIKPGETGYLYTSYASDLDNVSDINGLKLVPQFTVEATHATPTEYDVSDVSVSDGTFGIKTTGRVTNNSEVDNSYVSVYVIYYGVDNQVLGIDNTYITDLAAGKTVSFEASGLWSGNFKAKDISNCMVLAIDPYYGY